MNEKLLKCFLTWNENIWAILQNHLPKLKNEVNQLIK
jgi:uncharacterized protein with HEPN domain